MLYNKKVYIFVKNFKIYKLCQRKTLRNSNLMVPGYYYQIQQQKKTDSGIYLDEDTARKAATNILEVLEVGPHCKFVKKGDTIFIDPRPGSDAVVSEICGGSRILIQEHQVLGILK